MRFHLQEIENIIFDRLIITYRGYPSSTHNALKLAQQAAEECFLHQGIRLVHCKRHRLVQQA
jgi:hypothetical protein